MNEKNARTGMEVALCLCDLVQTTIGRTTSTKCVQDNNEDFYIRETSMLLTVLDIQHPIGQFIVSVCQSYYKQHGSGVKTLLYMTGMFLRISRNLLEKGLPLDVIIKLLEVVVDKCCKKTEEIKIPFSSRHDGEKLVDDRDRVGDNVNKTQKNEQGKASKNKSFLVDQSDRTSLNKQKTPNIIYLNAIDDKEIEDDKDLDWLLDDPLSKSVFGVKNELEGIIDIFDPVTALHANSQTFENSNKDRNIDSSNMSQTRILSDSIPTSPQRLSKLDSGIIVNQDGRQDPSSSQRLAKLDSGIIMNQGGRRDPTYPQRLAKLDSGIMMDQEGRHESDDEFDDCFLTDSSTDLSNNSPTHRISSCNKQTNTLANKTAEINSDLRCTSDKKAGRHFEHELETNLDKRYKDCNKYHSQSSDVIESDKKYHTQSLDVVESDNKYDTQSSDVVESENRYHTQPSDVVESDNKYHAQSSDVVESDNKYHAQSSDVVESDNKYHTQSSDIVESDVRMHKDETRGNRLFSCADLQENETVVKKISNDTKSKLLRENMTLSKLDALLKIMTPFADNKVCASKILSRSRHCKLLGSEHIGNMSHTTQEDNAGPELLDDSENVELCVGNISHTTTREDNTGPELQDVSENVELHVGNMSHTTTQEDNKGPDFLDDSENLELHVNNHLKSGQFHPQGSSDEVNGRCRFDENTANFGSTSFDKLLSDNMDKKFMTLSLGLSHGSEAIMKCILEARRLMDCQSGDKMRLCSVCIDGPLSQSPVLVPGLVLQIRTEYIEFIRCPLRTVIVNGDVLHSYKHIGHKRTLQSSVVQSASVKCLNMSWLDTVEEILDLYSIQCLVVRGSVSVEFSDHCLAKRIVVLDKVPFKSLQGLADHFNVAMVTYITDIYQENVFDAVIEPYYDDWVMKQKSHVIVKSTDNRNSVQTLILCHPSHNGCDLLEQEFNRCMGILSSASNTGYVLPGYARTEEFMSHFLTDLTDTSKDCYLSVVYEEAARGFHEFVQTVRFNIGSNSEWWGNCCERLPENVSTDPDIIQLFNTIESNGTLDHNIGRSYIVDDYETKLSGWRTALNTAITILQIDSLLINDHSFTSL